MSVLAEYVVLAESFDDASFGSTSDHELQRAKIIDELRKGCEDNRDHRGVEAFIECIDDHYLGEGRVVFHRLQWFYDELLELMGRSSTVDIGIPQERLDDFLSECRIGCGKLMGDGGEDSIHITAAASSCTEETCPEATCVVAPDRKSTRLNSSHSGESRMPSSA